METIKCYKEPWALEVRKHHGHVSACDRDLRALCQTIFREPHMFSSSIYCAIFLLSFSENYYTNLMNIYSFLSKLLFLWRMHVIWNYAKGENKCLNTLCFVFDVTMQIGLTPTAKNSICQLVVSIQMFWSCLGNIKQFRENTNIHAKLITCKQRINSGT